MSKKSFIQAGFTAAALSTAAILNSATAATAVEVTVTVDNLSPEQGLVLTPFWVGFHAGDYDLYEFGEAASPGLERIAEDGNPMPLREAFMSGNAARLDGVVTGEGISPESPPLIPPNTSATMTFDLDETHQFFSYASMILPSNDGFIGNESGTSYRLFDANGEFIETDFVVIGSQILDAGTETNDEAAENVPLLGQKEPDTGMIEGGIITKHPGATVGGDVLMAFPNADFTQGLYPLARIRVELSE